MIGQGLWMDAGLVDDQHQQVGMARGKIYPLPAFPGQLVDFPGQCTGSEVKALAIGALLDFQCS